MNEETALLPNPIKHTMKSNKHASYSKAGNTIVKVINSCIEISDSPRWYSNLCTSSRCLLSISSKRTRKLSSDWAASFFCCLWRPCEILNCWIYYWTCLSIAQLYLHRTYGVFQLLLTVFQHLHQSFLVSCLMSKLGPKNLQLEVML